MADYDIAITAPGPETFSPRDSRAVNAFMTGFLPDPGGAADIDPPSVAITTPSALTSRTAPVLFEVLDVSALARVFVAARFAAAGRTELIYDGVTFHAPYVTSTRVGNAFTIRRTGGWPSGFSLSVGAVDNAGNAV